MSRATNKPEPTAAELHHKLIKLTSQKHKLEAEITKVGAVWAMKVCPVPVGEVFTFHTYRPEPIQVRVTRTSASYLSWNDSYTYAIHGVHIKKDGQPGKTRLIIQQSEYEHSCERQLEMEAERAKRN